VSYEFRLKLTDKFSEEKINVIISFGLNSASYLYKPNKIMIFALIPELYLTLAVFSTLLGR
jgi:hypothetical protein